MGTQRKAWNEAMRSAGSNLLNKNSASQRRSSSRSKKQARRNQARKSTLIGQNASEFSSGLNYAQYQASIRIDVLEGVADHGLGGGTVEEDDFLDDDEKPKNRRKRSARSSSPATDQNSKRLKPRSLASLLMEDSGRSYGNTQKYLAAEARPPRSSINISEKPASKNNSNTNIKTTRMLQKLPQRKFCPVTGLFGIYTDPKTGIPYANLKALDQIQERAPPWLNASSSSYGNATYFEAISSLRGED